MIPKLRLNHKAIQENWKAEKNQKEVKRICKCYYLVSGSNDSDKIPVYLCGDEWIRLGVFKKYHGVDLSSMDYGYCNTQAGIKKYLQKYITSSDNFFVQIHFIGTDYEKLYKCGSYINELGEDAEEDFWSWVGKHPEDETKQEFENRFIGFTIFRLTV